jgi:recombination protein RecA
MAAKNTNTKKSVGSSEPKASSEIIGVQTQKPTLLQKVNALSKSYKSIGDPEFVKTGSLVMDAILGGGVPRGCFILWSSASGIGKSTGSMYIAKSYCVQKFKVLYLDFEGGVNKGQLDGIGLSEHLYNEKSNPTGTFYCYRVQSYVDAEAFLNAMMEEMDLVIIDSVTALLPEKIKTKSVEDILPGLQSRLMANLLLKYKAVSMKNGTSWIMINQMRTHIRFIGMTTDEEAGGNALKFFSDYRILMKETRNGKLERNEMTTLGVKKVPYGSINDIWCLKSRYSRPFIPLKLGIVFGKGISNNYAYYDFLNFKGCIRKEGAWYTLTINNEKKIKAQGENQIIEWINDNREDIDS